MKNIFFKIGTALSLLLVMQNCQDLDRPTLGDYPKDQANLPEGNLRFFVPFDKEHKELRFQFSEELSGNPSYLVDNSLSTEQGINSKGYKGNANAHLNYLNPNDFVAKAESFTIAYWMKHQPTTTNAEFVFSVPSNNGHWTKSTLMLMKEKTNTGIAVKFIIVDKNGADTWLTWEGSNAVPADGFFDEQWHHCAFVYDATTSALTFYKDGEKVGTSKVWGNHGAVNMDNSKVTGFKLGGPSGTDSWMKSWDGGLDQFRMYVSALTQSEIQALYTAKN